MSHVKVFATGIKALLRIKKLDHGRKRFHRRHISDYPLPRKGLACLAIQSDLNLPELSVQRTRFKLFNSPSFPAHPLRGWRTPLSPTVTVWGGIPSPISVSLILVSATTSRGLVVIPPPSFLAVVAPIPRLFATVVAPFAAKLVPATSFIMFLITVRHF